MLLAQSIAIDDKRHVPFEFVGKIASSSPMPEAGDIESGAWSRHCIGSRKDYWA